MATDEEKRKAAIERIQNKRGFWQHLVSYVVINAFLVAIWAIGGAGYFWPIWIIVPWGLGLVFHAWDTFGRKPITEDDIQREIDRGGDVV